MTARYVYISAPYTKGNLIENIRTAVRVAEMLVDFGLVPFVPHLTFFWDYLHPHDLDYWCAYDLNWLACCHCLLRLPGESKGADGEVEFAEEHGIPVFESIEDCLKWAREQTIEGGQG